MRVQTHRGNLSSGAEHTRLQIHFISVKREGKLLFQCNTELCQRLPSSTHARLSTLSILYIEDHHSKELFHFLLCTCLRHSWKGWWIADLLSSSWIQGEFLSTQAEEDYSQHLILGDHSSQPSFLCAQVSTGQDLYSYTLALLGFDSQLTIFLAMAIWAPVEQSQIK